MMGRRRAMTIASPCHGRRGSMYVIVLGTALLVMIIGLSAVSVARIDVRNRAAANDWADAGNLALSAVESAILRVNQVAAWRTVYTSGEMTPRTEYGRGSFEWMLVDETDDDLADNDTDPVRLYGIGRVGETVRVYSVLLQPSGEPLEALGTALHAAGQVEVKGGKTITLNGAPLSTNDNLKNDELVDGDVEAASQSGGGTITGTVTIPAPPKDLPAPSVFAMYRSLATPIPFSGDIKKTVLSPGLNPWGPTNADGVYYIDTAEHDFHIEKTRIHGTLVVETGGKKVVLDNPVFLHHYREDHPVLIVNGNLEIKLKSDSDELLEASDNVNFNPSGAPYEGESDTDLVDTYPNEVHGLVHVTGEFTLSNSSRVKGTVICEDIVTIDGDNVIEYDRNVWTNPPLGYTTGDTMVPLSSSWRWEAAP